MNFPVFDLHCDTLSTILGRDFQAGGSLRHNSGHIALDRGAALPGYAQCFACFTTTWEHLPQGITPETVFERLVEVFHREMDRNSDCIAQAFTAADVERNRKEGKMSGILTIEGPAGFGFDPARLEELYRVGFRITTLTWNERNPLAGSQRTGGGLTDLGKEYVREAQRMGMVIDVSHISDQAFWDIMEVTGGPVIASHSNSRQVWGVSRNLTDDMFRAICQTGGVAGLNQYERFLGEKATLDTVCDHLFHFLELDPDGTHVALGGDLDGCDSLPAGFRGVEDYPRLSQRLLERGLDEKTVHRIFWDNALGVMERCCM